MIQTGIWTGQKWAARLGHGPSVRVKYFKFDRGEVVFEYISTCIKYPQDVMDLTSFTQRFELVSNG
jgi:hypothetical protein